MLARTANSLFWMFRYLERAENTARLLDTGLRMALTRDVVSAEEEWRSVILTAGQRSGYEAKNASYTGMQAWNYVLRDKDNPSSVLAMLGNVRSNARQSRNVITGEVWEAVNDSWLHISEMLERPVGEQRVGEVVAAVRRAGIFAEARIAAAKTLPVDNPRFGDVIAIAPSGTAITRSGVSLKGFHGYAPKDPSMAGIFIAVGRGIPKGRVVPVVRSIDVAPTILALLGEEVPVWMEGRPVPDLLTAPGKTRTSDSAILASEKVVRDRSRP